MTAPTLSPRRWFRHRVTGRYAGLDLEVELPEGWRVEVPDFDGADLAAEPARLAVLASARSPDGALRLSIAARPAEMATPLVYSVVYLLGEAGIEIDRDDDRAVGPFAALGGTGWQRPPGSPSQALCWSFFEDGERLVHLRLAAPEALAAALPTLWSPIVTSFSLLAPRGQRQPLLAAAPPDPEPGPPRWWREAIALEEAGRIDDAIALVDRECPHLGALLTQAELWARRMRRVRAAGDLAAARQAHERAAALAWGYAAGATSGGEGAALSLERDRFLAELGPQP